MQSVFILLLVAMLALCAYAQYPYYGGYYGYAPQYGLPYYNGYNYSPYGDTSARLYGYGYGWNNARALGGYNQWWKK